MNSNNENGAITVVPISDLPAETKDIPPLTLDSLKYYPPEVQKEIQELADSINVTDFDKVMSYGAKPLMRTYNQVGEYLKTEQGSYADQQVAKMARDLFKEAKERKEEFTFLISDPGLFQKLFLWFSSSAAKKRSEEIKISAITNYKILCKLNDAMIDWLNQLKENSGNIKYSLLQDRSAGEELEEYILAGLLAVSRTEGEIGEIEENYQDAQLQIYDNKYNDLVRGLEYFRIVLTNLAKVRAAYKLSIGENMLSLDTNHKTQIAISTQRTSCTTVASMQLRNAILNLHNQEALKGQKELTQFNSELMKKVSSDVALTSQEAEECLMQGVYSVEAGMEAIDTVISAISEVMRPREEVKEELKNEIENIRLMMGKIEPYISQVKLVEGQKGEKAPKTLESSKSTRTPKSSKLTF